jgi:hypothetical protein
MRNEVPGYAITVPVCSSEPSLQPACLRRHTLPQHWSQTVLALRAVTGKRKIIYTLYKRTIKKYKCNLGIVLSYSYSVLTFVYSSSYLPYKCLLLGFKLETWLQATRPSLSLIVIWSICTNRKWKQIKHVCLTFIFWFNGGGNWSLRFFFKVINNWLNIGPFNWWTV